MKSQNILQWLYSLLTSYTGTAKERSIQLD